MDVKLVLTMMIALLFFCKSRKKGEYVSLTLNVKYEACSAESWSIRMIEA